MSVGDFIMRGLDPAKPLVAVSWPNTGAQIGAFFRSLRSEKTEAPQSVKLVWSLNPVDPDAERASVRVYIESLAQAYPAWFDPEPTVTTPGKRHFADLAEWMFTGRIAERGRPFSPCPDADCTRVRGYIEMTRFGTERIETVFLQVTSGPIELAGARRLFEWDTQR